MGIEECAQMGFLPHFKVGAGFIPARRRVITPRNVPSNSATLPIRTICIPTDV